jgi:hypothetical protein
VGDKLARAWDPAADVKAGQQCKGFGAAAINRLPTRMQVSWVNDTTMKLDWDLGTQSRLVYFDKTTPPGPPPRRPLLQRVLPPPRLPARVAPLPPLRLQRQRAADAPGAAVVLRQREPAG